MGTGEHYLNWAEGTTRSALTAIVAYCERTQYFNPISDKLTHRRIEHVIKGASRQEHQLEKQRGIRSQRLPLMPAHIQQLICDHQDVIPDAEMLVFPAAILTASVTLVRMGNLLATRQMVDPAADLTMQCVSLELRPQTLFALRLPRTKTSVAGQTIHVTDTENDEVITAFDALYAYHEWRIDVEPSEPDSPYFITTTGRTYTKNMALKTLRLMLTKNGDNEKLYGLHSTRHGGATALTEAGVSETAIASTAGWKSTAMVMKYAKQTSVSHTAEMQKRMERTDGVFKTKDDERPIKRSKKRRDATTQGRFASTGGAAAGRQS